MSTNSPKYHSNQNIFQSGSTDSKIQPKEDFQWGKKGYLFNFVEYGNTIYYTHLK